MIVRFLRARHVPGHTLYAPGEVAAFRDDVAARLIRVGDAVDAAASSEAAAETTDTPAGDAVPADDAPADAEASTPAEAGDAVDAAASSEAGGRRRRGRG